MIRLKLAVPSGHNMTHLHRRVGVHQAALVGELAVRAHQDLPRHCLPEHLYTQHIRNDFLRLLVNVRMDESHIIVARDAIPCVCVEKESAIWRTRASHPTLPFRTQC